IRGVSEEDFLNAFGRNIWDIYGEVIERHTGQGLMSCVNGRIALSDRGIDVSNMVLSEYLLHSS
ncbi:MAG: coproporphyrinogen III oxidase, partial [Lachnospiraceae bacterium]|nr:coproporphyrinogen III oxidase [Lachnospiraceae bacterium]